MITNISDRYRCIFIHIPKAAGTSIKEALHLQGQGHPPWQLFQHQFPQRWRTYLKFTVVRNPWDRVVSAYTYARMKESYWHDSRMNPHPDYELLRDKDFRSCCDILVHEPALLKHESWRPQYLWIAQVENGKGRLVVSDILRFERLQGDFDVLCEKLGIPRLDLPRTNASPREDYRDYYDQDTRNWIAEAYKTDIRLFNYTF